MAKEDCVNYYPPGRDPEYCMVKDDVFLHCEECEKYKSKNTKTNADRIRSMSDEELAEWIADKLANHGGGCCAPGCYDCSIHPDGCTQPWLKWLREEAT